VVRVSDTDNSGSVQYTPPYQADSDDWSLGDANHGFNVPNSVRKGGATCPHERDEIGNNGVSLRAHSVRFRCEECGDVRRFATSDFETTYWCDECEDVRWFKFEWELNRRSLGADSDRDGSQAGDGE
jgi:predicted RNA-binding Zn-ribbon protein involved in translation (DUF1610 family)